MEGFPDPCDHFLVVKVMAGLQKNRPQGDLRLPISLQSLTNMLAILDKMGLSHYLNALYKAMLTVSFFAFLRPGECTGLLHNLQYQDVSFEQGSLTIIFSHYKHSSGPPFVLKVPSARGHPCPVRTLAHFLSLRGNSQGHLFCYKDGSFVSYYS